MEQRARAILRELPVEVPRGTGALTVALSHPPGRGVLDLGLLGPEGEFRGWSGGARDTFTVTQGWATPGYLPGPLHPGTWRVLVRLHRIPPEGLPYRVRALATGRTPAPPPEDLPPPPVAPRERRSRRAVPAADGARWLAGDLHAHTVHSDGSLTVDELARCAALAGLDFLAVTDHNTVSHHPLLPAAGARQDVLLLPGQEVTTDLGHANVFGDTGWIDFRRGADSWLARAEAHGGVLSVNHPLAGDCAWQLPFTRRRPRHAELWHHTWTDRRHGAPLAWARAWREDLVPLGGSDFHRPQDGRPLGAPTTWVLCRDGDVLGGLAAGHTAVSAAPDAPVLLRYGGELLALDADGTVLVRPDGERRVVRGDTVRLPAAPRGVHRLETHQGGVLALST
ncbi:PHP domain-containing protein [Streptomyces albus subsp. chlorinus]|nr:PHP domain-containing protein [Streptomyces albus subsp. chlorinus]